LKKNQNRTDISTTTHKTTTITGEEIVVSTSNPYETKVFSGKTDWRFRAIAASNLNLRINHIYVQHAHDVGITFVMPKNLIKKFIQISDLRTQVGAYIFGVSPPGHDEIKEIRAFVIPPQLGTHNSVSLAALQANDYLSSLELLGWVHTTGGSENHFTPQDMVTFSKVMADNKLDGEKAVSIVTTFTPGSSSLACYRSTPEGYAWGKTAQKKK